MLISALTSNSVPVTELILSMLLLVRVTDCQKLEKISHRCLFTRDRAEMSDFDSSSKTLLVAYESRSG